MALINMVKDMHTLQIIQLLSLILIIQMLKESVCVETRSESQEVFESEYNAYYSESQKLMFSHEKDDESDEPKISLFDVFWPFIQTFWWTFVAIIVVLLTLLCFCLINAFDLTTICKPLEYFPCQGHSILLQRLERLKTPGVYIRDNGIKEYYEPIVDESEIANDISERLQRN